MEEAEKLGLPGEALSEAAEYWEKKDAVSKQADRKSVLEAAERFIRSHNTCALAAGCGSFVRCTPLEYSYKDGKFWIFSEGGLKFRALSQNKNVCLAIFDAYAGFGELGGMQVTGRAELPQLWSEEYTEMLEYKKIPPSAIRKLEHPMYLIKITPERIDFLSSEFKKQGFEPRQHVEF